MPTACSMNSGGRAGPSPGRCWKGIMKNSGGESGRFSSPTARERLRVISPSGPTASAGPFTGRGIPELTDLIVFIRFQRRGIGSRLLEAAEKAAASSGSAVTLGVGLHSGYGPAQRLYVKRGYIPDGSGVWFRDQPLDPYADCRNDDELILYMSKKLKREGGADDEA